MTNGATAPRVQEQVLSLDDLTAMLSAALLKLHNDNLLLQTKLGNYLAKGAPTAALIGEFQVLDLHAQIAKDLAEGLKTLSQGNRFAHISTGETVTSLFQLDATRLALQEAAQSGGASQSLGDENVLL